MTPETLESQLIETWQINNRVNLMLLDEIPDEAMDFTIAPRGGGQIGRQFAHIYNVRFWKMEAIDRPRVKGDAAITKEIPISKEILADALDRSADWFSEIFRQSVMNDGQVKGFKKGIIPLLGYLISHEAHHRGSILLNLKQGKFKRSDLLKYGIWEWNKI